MKKTLIIGIILLIISMGLFIYNEFIDNRINIYEITNSGTKKEGSKVYLDATFVAGTITNDKDNGYYVIFGDGVQYIVYMKHTEANKLNRYLLDNPDDSKRVVGVTKLINEDMEENGKKFVKEWLDNNHTHEVVEENHTHDITTDDFYHYFGYVYVDTTEFNIIKLIIYITGITSILFIFYSVNTKYHFIG